MENNNIENTTNNANPVSEKKNGLMIIIIVLIAIAIIAVIAVKSSVIKPKVEAPDQTTTELDNSLKADTTTEINTNLDKINVDDTSSADLKEVDGELEKL